MAKNGDFGKLLATSKVFRHLITKAKLKLKCVVKLRSGEVIEGVLRIFDYNLKLIEIKDKDGNTVFVNLPSVEYIKVFDKDVPIPEPEKDLWEE